LSSVVEVEGIRKRRVFFRISLPEVETLVLVELTGCVDLLELLRASEDYILCCSSLLDFSAGNMNHFDGFSTGCLADRAGKVLILHVVVPEADETVRVEHMSACSHHLAVFIVGFVADTLVVDFVGFGKLLHVLHHFHLPVCEVFALLAHG